MTSLFPLVVIRGNKSVSFCIQPQRVSSIAPLTLGVKVSSFNKNGGEVVGSQAAFSRLSLPLRYGSRMVRAFATMRHCKRTHISHSKPVLEVLTTSSSTKTKHKKQTKAPKASPLVLMQ